MIRVKVHLEIQYYYAHLTMTCAKYYNSKLKLKQCLRPNKDPPHSDFFSFLTDFTLQMVFLPGLTLHQIQLAYAIFVCGQFEISYFNFKVILKSL